MAERLLTATIFLCSIGSGLMAGLFFTYSNSVMPALARVPAAQGMLAMNTINSVIQNPLFFAAFMGTAVLSLLAAALALFEWSGASPWILAGAGLYLIGNIAITIGINVPMNNALAAVAPDSPQAAALWTGYLDRWVMWNHVRALACTGALAAFIAALMQN